MIIEVNMKKLFILSLALFSISFCTAQNYVDLARFHYATTPENDFDSIGGSTHIQEFGADLMFPIQLKD